jgi:hypothetical protein
VVVGGLAGAALEGSGVCGFALAGVPVFPRDDVRHEDSSVLRHGSTALAARGEMAIDDLTLGKVLECQ